MQRQWDAADHFWRRNLLKILIRKITIKEPGEDFPSGRNVFDDKRFMISWRFMPEDDPPNDGVTGA